MGGRTYASRKWHRLSRMKQARQPFFLLVHWDMRLRWLDALVLSYGILLIALALYAFETKHSIMSLIMGGGSGVLEIGLAALSLTHPRPGRIGCAVVALILSVFFVQQCIKSDFKWDFVVLAVASIIVVVSLMGGHLYAMSKKKASETPA